MCALFSVCVVTSVATARSIDRDTHTMKGTIMTISTFRVLPRTYAAAPWISIPSGDPLDADYMLRAGSYVALVSTRANVTTWEVRLAHYTLSDGITCDVVDVDDVDEMQNAEQRAMSDAENALDYITTRSRSDEAAAIRGDDVTERLGVIAYESALDDVDEIIAQKLDALRVALTVSTFDVVGDQHTRRAVYAKINALQNVRDSVSQLR